MLQGHRSCRLNHASQRWSAAGVQARVSLSQGRQPVARNFKTSLQGSLSDALVQRLPKSVLPRKKAKKSPPPPDEEAGNVILQPLPDSGRGRSRSCETIIVGAGITGYATAIALAQAGFKDVHLLERKSSSSTLNPRKGGLCALDSGSRADLQALGIDLSTIPTEAPSRPGDSENGTAWFSRRHLLESMHSLAASYSGTTINVCYSCNVLDVYWPRPGMRRDSVVLGVVNHNGEYTFWAPNCLLGADGVSSTVARTLRHSYPGEGFEMRKSTSDSAGLAFKAMVLDAEIAELRKFADKTCPPHSMGFSISSRGSTQLRVCGTGGCPVATFIMWPHHKLCRATFEADLYDLLEEEYPTLNFRKILPKKEAERFIEAKTSQFPCPQFCSNVHKSFAPPSKPLIPAPVLDRLSVGSPSMPSANPNRHSAAGCLVLLMGAAARAFPPDLGQTANAGLQDVMALQRGILSALPERETRSFIEDAAALDEVMVRYEEARVPENKALVRISQVGMPYRYEQQGTSVKHLLWRLNAALRAALASFAPSFFSPSVSTLLLSGAKAQLSYCEMMERARATTRRLLGLCAIAVVAAALLLKQGLLAA